MKDIKVGGAGAGASEVSPESGRGSRLVSQALWFLATTRNILVVLVCAAAAYYFDTRQQQPFILTGQSTARRKVVSIVPSIVLLTFHGALG